MKLKALKPRLHNVMFHTHTVSGIVISFALFVCFYAGAVALFMDEIYRWENPKARFEAPNPDGIDYDKVLHSTRLNAPNLDLSKRFSFTPPNEQNPFIWFYGNLTTDKEKSERFQASINPHTYKVTPFKEPKTHMIRTIYELHYFRQLPVIGIYLSGFVAFFFLFAIFTGILTHWKNIITKFYAFTTKGNWKQIWINSHTSLGVIVLPFQITYAVTGALLGLSILLLAPSAYLLFDGDTNEIIKAVKPDSAIPYDEDAQALENGVSFNRIIQAISAKYPDKKITFITTNKFNKEDGTIAVSVDDKTGISGDGIFVYGRKDGKLLEAVVPDNKSYAKGVYGVLKKLHYATYGGIFLKIIYFILAMITCYIIISGIMIWRTARDNLKYTQKQRAFHHRVTKVNLAICLSMFPAIALIFIINKVVPMALENRILYVNSMFFLGWLLLSLAGLSWNDYRKLNRNYILLGSGLGLLIPIINGVVTRDWIWKTLSKGQYYVFSVDATWLVIGVSGLLICRYYLQKKWCRRYFQKNEN
ncbi:PepSY-associated TM helix domain-containing protein [Maribacter antarcticus]|uniref:PepSY-associated TM helix domain-containing protein n=1 Tax=Maribacter antarcticus TaxID=505250 RepID=UPI00047CD630|nr:PepSY-associated TM helix domain-containing protein [Maribacter antarcticus]